MDPFVSSLADEIIRYLHRSSCSPFKTILSPFKTIPLCMGSNHALPQHIQTRGRSVFGCYDTGVGERSPVSTVLRK